MAEVQTGDAERPEAQPNTNLEILDFQNYGSLYSRFLIASIENQADTSKASGIIDPNVQVEFTLNNITSLDQKQRNYNPTFERFSFAERDELWKEFSYEDAYQSWRTQFTEAIKNIKDEKRIGAFQTILPGKAPSDFTPNDADFLFELFSEDKSDVTEFVGVITRKLGHETKIDPAYLKILIPHFEWIASGLFGRQTASMVTRLIELESELHNNPNNVIAAFTANKDRINTPQNQERRLLGAVHATLIHQQRVISDEEEDEEEEEIIPPPLDHSISPVQPPAPQTPATSPETAKPAKVEPPTTRPQDTTASPSSAESSDAQSIHTPKVHPELEKYLRVKEIGISGKPLMEELNDALRSETENHLNVSVPPDKLLEYMISSLGEDMKTEIGEMQIGNDGKEITIPQAKISRTKRVVFVPVTGTVTLNNINIRNNPSAPGKISATIGRVDKDAVAQTAEWVMGKIDIDKEISAINDTFLEELNSRINRSNRAWTPKSLFIEERKIIVGFEKSS